MDHIREVQPLSYTKRRRTFFFLLAIFIISLPFLYLYATGYRFDPRDPNAIVGTGGIYVAAERTGAEIYIDDELVRETRVFRTAFYAQNLEPKTHRVHVQKEGHHTWVKELPVTSHRVTEAQSFNMPLVPKIRIVSEYTSPTGSPIVRTLLPYASTTSEYVATTTKATSSFLMNPEFVSLIKAFRSTGTIEKKTLIERVQEEVVSGTTTPDVEYATTTKQSGGVTLERMSDNTVSAMWVGSFEQMPYYYCASSFPRYSTSSEGLGSVHNQAFVLGYGDEEEQLEEGEDSGEFVHPIQQIPADIPCDRRIRIDAGETIHSFDFFPGSTDFIVVGLDSGVYVMEIDPRAWQNKQPLLLGEHLQIHIENGTIYVYDDVLIYQVILDR